MNEESAEGEDDALGAAENMDGAGRDTADTTAATGLDVGNGVAGLAQTGAEFTALLGAGAALALGGAGAAAPARQRAKAEVADAAAGADGEGVVQTSIAADTSR